MEIGTKEKAITVTGKTIDGREVLFRLWNPDELKEYDGGSSKKVKRIKVKRIKVKKNEPVWDVAVKDNRNFFANKILVHNCFEIGFIPVTKSGRYGYQFCNLTTQNGAKIRTLEEWKKAARAAAIIGTIQASYTYFEYLSAASKELTEEEALLGVSMTGWFDNPDLLLDEENQYMIAKLTTKVNKEWAELIGINQAARVTCTKPEGCQTLDGEIKTTDGIKTLRQIFEENGINTDTLSQYEKSSFLTVNKDIYVYDENNEEKKITQLFVNGEAEVFEIEAEDGSIYRFTGNHQLKTNNGWKRVDELTEDEEIISFAN